MEERKEIYYWDIGIVANGTWFSQVNAEVSGSTL